MIEKDTKSVKWQKCQPEANVKKKEQSCRPQHQWVVLILTLTIINLIFDEFFFVGYFGRKNYKYWCRWQCEKKSKKTARTEKGKTVKHTNPGSLYSYNSFRKIQKQFRTNLKERCDRICNCCGGLWFPKSVRKLSKDTLRLKGITNDFINSAFYVDPSSEVFCQTVDYPLFKENCLNWL